MHVEIIESGAQGGESWVVVNANEIADWPRVRAAAGAEAEGLGQPSGYQPLEPEEGYRFAWGWIFTKESA